MCVNPQANTLCNEEDKAFQSRLLLITFDSLKNTEDADPNLYSEWVACRELLSALAPDFASILHEDNLDREAIQDCAAFLQRAIGRKRDRNANMWAVLLYFMLTLNIMFQANCDAQVEVFEWMVKTVTRSMHELNSHQSILEQFVLHILKCKELRSSPLGREEETLYLHNLRENSSTTPVSNIFMGSSAHRYWAVRVESVVGVIKKITGRTFSAQEVYRLAEESEWACKGDCHFYDTARNAWPITKTVVDDQTMRARELPLLESELLEGHVGKFKCIFVRVAKVLEIGGGVDKAKALESYEDIVIESANRDAGTYNFYEVVTGNDDETSWFGYRALQQCNFKLYNGMLNALNLGANDTELEIVHEVRVANDKAGFRSIQQLYQPSMLLTQYDYSFPDEDDLPPAYTMCPFGARNEPDDPPICATSPPWKERQHKKRKVEDIASPDKGGGYNSDDEAVLFGEVDDETKGLTTGTTSAEGMGSTGTGTPRQKVKPVVKQDEESQDVGGYDSADEKYRPYSPDFSPPPAPVKRRKAKRNRFIADEASASDDESDQARAQPRMRTRSLTT